MDRDQEDLLREMAREIGYLRDRQDILDCVAAYCRGLDRLDEPLLRSAYHADAMDRHADFLGDRDAFVPWALEVGRLVPATVHGVTTHTCEIDGDTAYAESYVIFLVVPPEGGDNIVAGSARYVDQLARRDGRWAITKRCEVMDCIFEAPRSTVMGPEWLEVKARRDAGDLSYQRPLNLPVPGQPRP